MEEGVLARSGVTLTAVLVHDREPRSMAEAVPGGAPREEMDMTLHAGRCAQTVCRHCPCPPIRFSTVADGALATLVAQSMEEVAEEACFKYSTLNHAVTIAQVSPLVSMLRSQPEFSQLRRSSHSSGASGPDRKQ